MLSREFQFDKLAEVTQFVCTLLMYFLTCQTQFLTFNLLQLLKITTSMIFFFLVQGHYAPEFQLRSKDQSYYSYEVQNSGLSARTEARNIKTERMP